MEIIKSIVPTKEEDKVVFEFDKTQGRGWDKSGKKSGRSKKRKLTTESFARTSINNSAFSKHVPSIDLSKMLSRPEDVFSINMDNVGEYYNTQDAFSCNKDYSSVIKFERQSAHKHLINQSISSNAAGDSIRIALK
jgi:hypothetical protein